MPKPDYYEKTTETAKSMLKGAAIGVVGRWATFPIEKIYLDRSKHPTLSYAELCRFNFTPNILVKVQTRIFFNTGMGQTVGKAISTMGVVRVVEENYAHLSPIKKGLMITILSSPLEWLATVRGEYCKLLMFSANEKHATVAMQRHGILTPVFYRFAGATMLRCTGTSLFTYCTIYPMEKYIKSFFPTSKENSPIIKATAAGISTSVIQIVVMPLINLQTQQANHPESTLAETAKSLVKTPNKLFAGTLGRSVNRGAYYAIAFFGNEYSKRWNNKQQQSLPKEPGPSAALKHK